MIKIFYSFLLTLLLTTCALANYETPGTGVHFTLDDLVTFSGGAVTFSDGTYFVNDTVKISTNDMLYIYNNAVVKFAPSTFLSVFGTLLVNPPDSVLFTAADLGLGFLGVRVDSSNTSVVRKLTFEYATSFRLNDCSILIDSCTFRYNNHQTSTTFGNGAVSLFRARPLITNSLFFENKRAAIQGGSNVANVPVITGNTFIGNNTNNLNVPQINMGATGVDTVYILNNQILRASTNSGGIGFLPIGNVNAVVKGNIIKNNRYGITFNGGSNINALISYNEIDSNNTQGDPMVGGSGIAFTGGSSTSHQNSIVTGNLIRWNLWGVTIQGGSRPNLGNITNADTLDDGKNYFFENTNSSTPWIDLYNNSVDTIYAQNNYWGTEDTLVMEERIFHFNDNPALGPVIFMPGIVPVELTSFSAAVVNNSVILKWQTATEVNNSGFEILRDNESAGFVPGNGTTTEPFDYVFTDNNLSPGVKRYTLIQIDHDGTRTVLKETEVEVGYTPVEFSLNQNYPNPFNPSTKITFSVPSAGKVSIKVFNTIGEEVASILEEAMEAGIHSIDFNASNLTSGIYLYQMVTENFVSTRKMVVIK
jgi:hypothetical protein